MFQNAWCERSTAPKRVDTITLPNNHITPNQIESVRTIYWDEHCLECSAPACYSTCPLYIKRPDGACRRFDYGIYVMKPAKDTLWRVRLKFRKWAKIEARINKGTIGISDLKRMDSRDCTLAKVFKIVSTIGGYSYSRRFDGIRRKKYASVKSDSRFVCDFLWQCNYYGENAFTLLFEITDRDNKVIFKTGFETHSGYNQELLKLDFPLPEGGLVRIYPENNFSPEIEIYAADFVKLRDTFPNSPAKKIKCVAWDLDNTIWAGILAESNPSQLVIRPKVLETIKELDRRGIIQIVVSKNDRDAVEPVLKRLGIKDYFVYVFANWNPKSENIYYASRMLNIGIDTFALIDDSIFERTEVSDSLPSVRVYDENQLLELFSLPEFDVPITEESSMRRQSYQQEAVRKQIRDTLGGQNTEFIRNCGIVATLEPLSTPEQRKRSLELLLRTNQLNLSAHRYGDEEFSSLLEEPGTYSLVMNVRDRFGDYGQVAFIHFKVESDLVITEYAMSCRVAAKLIENALFSYLMHRFCKDIIARGVRTERNVTLVDAFTKTGFKQANEDSTKIELILKSDREIPNNNCVKIRTVSI